MARIGRDCYQSALLQDNKDFLPQSMRNHLVVVRMTIQYICFFIRQTNVVSLNLCVNVYSGFIHFPLHGKRSGLTCL